MCCLSRINALNYTSYSLSKQSITLGSLWKIDNVCLCCQILSLIHQERVLSAFWPEYRKKKNHFAVALESTSVSGQIVQQLFQAPSLLELTVNIIYLNGIQILVFILCKLVGGETPEFSRGQKSSFLDFSLMFDLDCSLMFKVARPNQSKPNGCVCRNFWIDFK